MKPVHRVLVDTDILIDYSKGKSTLLKRLLDEQNRGKMSLFINPVIIAEFLADKSLLDTFKEKQANQFLNRFSVVALSKKVGVLAGGYLRKKATSFLADSMIAATCVEDKLKLATRNKKDFKKVKGLKFLEI